MQQLIIIKEDAQALNLQNPMGTRKNFFQIYRQLWHAPSKKVRRLYPKPCGYCESLLHPPAVE